MQLARVVRMPSGVEQVPLVTASPTSGFVSPAYGGLKPSSEVEWTAATLTAAEIGVVVPVPDAFLADTSFPVWDSVREEITKSFVRVFEKAALYGTNSPSDWPAGGLTAAAHADPASGADALAAIDAAMALLEANGVPVDGILGGAALRSGLRQTLMASLTPFSNEPPALWGVPIHYSSFWDDTVGIALVGGWDVGVIAGVRQDITFDVSSEGVITDSAGAVVLNALQSDSSIMRCFMRTALQAVQPVGSSGAQVKSLALATITTPPPLSASRAKAS
jgi:hypothetical protein